MRSLSISALSLLILGVVASATPTPIPSDRQVLRRSFHADGLARRHGRARRGLSGVAPNDTVQDKPLVKKAYKRAAKCKPRSTSASSSAPTAAPPAPNNIAQDPKPKSSTKASASSSSAPKSSPKPAPAPPSSGGSRMDMIKNMHAFSGFVYAVSACQSKSQMTSDFKEMVSVGSRTVITFDRCNNGNEASFYGDLISAAGAANIKVIPLVMTLSTNIQSEMSAVIQAVIANPDPVLAVALGDEPLFDGDFGSPDNLANQINSMKSQFQAKGLNIPVSISDLAFGWQSAGSPSSVINAVDFFMINNFPYFAGNAQSPDADSTWSNFQNDISYFEGIANGKPLLVTQTGWPSNEEEFAPTNKALTTSVSSEQQYYQLLDGHCSDFFKPKNIGWMFRSWDDGIVGWGVKDANGNRKFTLDARTSC